MVVISVSNQKGGVGKTTTSVSVATALAMKGRRTLLIDGDPQSNATRHFLKPGQFSKSLADVVLEFSGVSSSPLREAVVETSVEGLGIVPSNVRLAMFEQMPSDSIHTLREKLAEVEGDYDYVIIDNPPSLGQLLLASLIASTHLLIPVTAEPLSHDGLDDLMNTYGRISSRSNKEIALLGVVTTKFDVRLNVCGAVHLQTKERFGDLVFDTIIHANSKLIESPAFSQPIQLYSAQSRGALNYMALADEILQRLEGRAAAEEDAEGVGAAGA